MNDNNQRIKAVRYDTPDSQNRQDTTTGNISNHVNTTRPIGNQATNAATKKPWWYSQFNLMLTVFALLALAVVMFIVLIPAPTVEQLQAESNISDPSSNISTNTDAISDAPWDVSRRAQARTDAQEILSNLLDGKKDLEDKQVEIWAPVEFEKALAKAELGDEYYKEQDFPLALSTYESAVDELNNLYQLIPTYVKSKISAGQKALEEGKSQLAQMAFSEAVEIEPDNFTALNGLARASTLDEVLELARLAHDDEQDFAEQDDLQLLINAQQKLEKAIAIDNNNESIKEQLQVIKSLQTDKRYRLAMSKGFNALFVNNYSRAGSAFTDALKIRPNDETARLAYQQSLASNKTASLQSLLDRALALENNEDWGNALSNYQTVLQRDPNQIAAKLGEIRSRARNQLDTDLRGVLEDVLLLSRSKNKSEAENLLKEARAIRVSGPKLNAQISKLSEALESTSDSIKVQIISDSLTAVTLSKVGANQVTLGSFASKNLVLKPGRYVLTGVRSGFKDERKEIDLYSGSNDLQYLEIRCDQPIGLSSLETSDDAA